MSAAQEALRALQVQRPSFHGIDLGAPSNIQIGDDVLTWLAAEVPAGGTTLETGSGYTTVVLTCASARHIAVAPAATEFAAIRAFLASHALPSKPLEEHVGISQRVLPALDLPTLDLVLVDGDHAFPAPFIDYYYVADHVRDGGLLLVDDCQLRTGHLLREFLVAEPGWDHVQDLGKTAVFRRRGSEPPTGRWWHEQPWLTPRYAVAGNGAGQRMRSLRTQLQLGSLLRRRR